MSTNEKLQRTTKHGTGQEITKVHTKQGKHKKAIVTRPMPGRSAPVMG